MASNATLLLTLLTALSLMGCAQGIPLPNDDPDAGGQKEADACVGCVEDRDIPTPPEDPPDAEPTPCERVPWYVDRDNDGHGNTQEAPVVACEMPPGHAPAGDDCNDADETIHPDIADAPGDGIDSDCDGAELCFLDADGDGRRPDGDALVQSEDLDCDDPGEATDQTPTGDCDDGNPALELPSDEVCDGLDNDCDGVIDNGADCPCTPMAREGHAYLFCNDGIEWLDAQNTCVNSGYHLAVINDGAENAWIAEQLGAMGTEKAWIGLSDGDVEGQFFWVDGSALDFTQWTSGNPSGGGEDCVEMVAPQAAWNDKECNADRRFVCESGGL